MDKLTRKRVDYITALYEAKDLKSEDGENKEYDRALCELVARLFPYQGVPTEERAEAVAIHLKMM